MSPVVPADSTLTAEASAVTLARYQQIIGVPICSFWGVARDSERVSECREIWTKPQRDMVARYLAEAQEEIEAEAGYFLSPRYVVGALADQPLGLDRYVDDQVYTLPTRARWQKVIAGGVRAVTNIQLGAAASNADPAVIGPVATTVTNPDEIYVYHPGSDVELVPSRLVLSGGQVTIYIPRCRMVKEALADNPPEGLNYADDANFESTVDLKRVYTDPATQAQLVTPHTCSSTCSSAGCGEHTQTGCIYVIDPLLGHLRVLPATYTDGAWRTNGAGCCPHPTRARLNYLAGMAALTRQAEDTIVRLAHAKMPNGPCGCDPAQNVWKRDRHVPDVLTRERINCPWGLSDGAWTAWRFGQALKQTRGSVL